MRDEQSDKAKLADRERARSHAEYLARVEAADRAHAERVSAAEIRRTEVHLAAEYDYQRVRYTTADDDDAHAAASEVRTAIKASADRQLQDTIDASSARCDEEKTTAARTYKASSGPSAS